MNSNTCIKVFFTGHLYDGGPKFYRSVVASAMGVLINYTIGEWNKPKIENTPIFAYEMSCQDVPTNPEYEEMWECEYDELFTEMNQMLSPAEINDANIVSRFWRMVLEEHITISAMTDTTHVGTLLVKSIKPIRRIK